MAAAEPADGAPGTLLLLFEVYFTSVRNLGAALATIMVHAVSNLGAGFVQGICSGRALQCRCDTKSDCKCCH